ncbi:methylenetetrahydrofolate reductase C-terminal domain-containing protein [Syntrophus gentianae]|nr:methylenetetrahydrofolate reductase C-terminal domain-containing protein [Syntrophus gentianae]
MENLFERSLKDPSVMTVTWELVPGRGAREKAQESVLLEAEKAARGGKIQAVSVTDNPGGQPALMADSLACEIKALGIEPLVHFTCKDKNRSQIESQLYALERAGVRNLLVMSGDYPVSGFMGRPQPVFDLDPTHVLALIRDMNSGLEYPLPKGTGRLQPGHFFAGAAVSPFKQTEAELLGQYYKLKKKIDCGASFVVTQLGYDIRKFQEVLLYMKRRGIEVPVLGNVYILSYPVARLMKENRLPGCVVTDGLMAQLDRERSLPDKGVEARLLRAAKMYALLKGLGFSGAHIGGHLVTCEQVESVIEKGEELSASWETLIREFQYPLPGGFYFFQEDPYRKLNQSAPESRQGLSSDVSEKGLYGFSIFLHNLFFEPGRKGFALMRLFARKLKGTRLENFLHKLEHLLKTLLYDCRDCGDCALVDVAFLCPMSQCPKQQRNGPCGGSYQGWCEVYPGRRRCIYVRAYSRLKSRHQENLLEEIPVAPCNWDLNSSSAWLNFFLGKDHTAKRLGISELPDKPESSGSNSRSA